jgi:ketosteroid isomerase-like protein
MLTPTEIAKQFYTAFQQKDGNAMAALYHPSARFSDPVFPNLTGTDAGRMWRMLCGRSKELNIEFNVTDTTADSAKVHWVATYRFGPAERFVRNSIHATLKIRDGKIVEHTDAFNFWIWSQQALGLLGLLLGWTPIIQNKVRAQAAKSLENFKE